MASLAVKGLRSMDQCLVALRKFGSTIESIHTSTYYYIPGVMLITQRKIIKLKSLIFA